LKKDAIKTVICFCHTGKMTQRVIEEYIARNLALGRTFALGKLVSAFKVIPGGILRLITPKRFLISLSKAHDPSSR
jgi:hypothetical protein